MVRKIWMVFFIYILWQKSLLETHKKYFLGLDSTQLLGIEIFKVMLNSVSKINFYIIMSGIKYYTRGSKQAVLVIIECSSPYTWHTLFSRSANRKNNCTIDLISKYYYAFHFLHNLPYESLWQLSILNS